MILYAAYYMRDAGFSANSVFFISILYRSLWDNAWSEFGNFPIIFVNNAGCTTSSLYKNCSWKSISENMRFSYLIFFNVQGFADLIGWNRAVNTHIITSNERFGLKPTSRAILNAYNEHLQQRNNKVKTGRSRFRNYQKFWSNTV